MGCSLQGVGVLVTRPSGQGEGLCRLITEQGGRAIHFPTISIGSAVDQAAARDILQRLSDYHLAIFISPNAVRYGLGLMAGVEVPAGVKVCAVGKGTARALTEQGIEVDVRPDGRFDSEALLLQPELNHVDGKRILILRGNGGRELLADSLRQRGAEVDYAEVYSRTPATADAGRLIAAWKQDVQIVTVTSVETLENLMALLGKAGSAMLYNTPLVVVSERILIRAQELGCRYVILADEASDQGLLRALCGWAGRLD
jgi:uroporphyrinogen-III synthase